MEKQRIPPSETKIPEPLSVFAKNASLRFLGGKEILENFTSALMPSKQSIGCLPVDTNVHKCEDINDDTKKSDEDYPKNNNNNNNNNNINNNNDYYNNINNNGRFGKLIAKGSRNFSLRDESEETNSESEMVCLSNIMDKLELSFDGEWLRRHLRLPLKLAIKEIVAKKPYDPVHYLGFWLLNYRKLQDQQQWSAEEKQELDYYRSFVQKPVFEEEEEVSVDKGEEEEEEPQDWNFKYYDPSYSDVKF